MQRRQQNTETPGLRKTKLKTALNPQTLEPLTSPAHCRFTTLSQHIEVGPSPKIRTLQTVKHTNQHTDTQTHTDTHTHTNKNKNNIQDQSHTLNLKPKTQSSIQDSGANTTNPSILNHAQDPTTQARAKHSANGTPNFCLFYAKTPKMNYWFFGRKKPESQEALEYLFF